jgi:hypothetical protein
LLNKAKKPGEVEKTSSFKRNRARFYRKFTTNFKIEKQEYYPNKVPERSKEERDRVFSWNTLHKS